MAEASGPVGRGERARALFELADAQAGFFTAAQAERLGYSRRVRHHHRGTGAWLAAGHGLYRLRDYPHREDEELVRLSLWSRDRSGTPRAVASHETALRLYGLSDLMPAKTHLSVPPGFRKPAPPGVVLHKASLLPGDVRAFLGFGVTTPRRTLLDLAGSALSPEHLEMAVRQAMDRGLVRRAALEAALDGLPAAARERLAAALEGVFGGDSPRVQPSRPVRSRR